MNLKTRILLVVLALLTAGIWGLAARVAVVLQADLEKVLADQMAATVGYVAADIDSKMQMRIDMLKELAQSIEPAILADQAKLQSYLEQHKTSSALFPSGVMVANKQGIAVADYPRFEGRAGGFIGDRPYFQETMASGQGSISRPYLSRFLNRPFVALTAPLTDASAATVGVLIGPAYLSDQNLFGQLEQTKIGKTGYFVVISPKDRLIVSASEKSRIMQPLPAKGVNPLLDRRLADGFEGAGVATTSLGVETLTVSRNMKTTGWFVLAGVSTEEAFAPIVTLKRQIYLAALLMSLVMMVILRFVLARQMLPLEQAGAAMRRMTEGEEPLMPLPIRREDEIGRLVGHFNRLVVERRRAEQEIRELNETLEVKVAERTRELEAFSYSVAHDLRGPLRAIDGFSQLVLSENADKLDQVAQGHLRRVRAASQRLGDLIDDLLQLSLVSRADLQKQTVNLNQIAGQVMEALIQAEPEREVAFSLQPEMSDQADPFLARILLENLLGNAWKYTGKISPAKIEFGCLARNGQAIYFVRDNGAGFDMAYADKLFAPFQRLHNRSDFEGSGIGLSIVQRIVARHGGQIWAEGKEGEGATFSFTLA